MSIATTIAFDYCHRITKASGTTFYYASHLLPERQRQALWAVYAFARHVDDVVDEACEDGTSVALALLDEWRRVLDQCFIGRAIHPCQVEDNVRQGQATLKNVRRAIQIVFQ